MASPTLWALNGTYLPREGNDIRILIDGQAAYDEVAAAFQRAKSFIYLTLSYGNQDFLPVPANNQTMFDILRSRRRAGVDVRMVVWEPATDTADTIPDPSPAGIPGVNEGRESVPGPLGQSEGLLGPISVTSRSFLAFPLAFPCGIGMPSSKNVRYGRR